MDVSSLSLGEVLSMILLNNLLIPLSWGFSASVMPIIWKFGFFSWNYVIPLCFFSWFFILLFYFLYSLLVWSRSSLSLSPDILSCAWFILVVRIFFEFSYELWCLSISSLFHVESSDVSISFLNFILKSGFSSSLLSVASLCFLGHHSGIYS